MEKIEFKSQVCTTRKQSQKLLQLGLKESTADCHWFYHLPTSTWCIVARPYDGIGTYYPAWSLHRLMEIMPKNIGCYEQFVSCYKNNVMYINDDGYSFFNRTKNDNLYDGIIDRIKWAIVNQYINQQFLEGKQCEK